MAEKKERLGISWRKPRTTHFGVNYETSCEGFLNGIEVYQNRFIRKHGKNDITYKIAGVSGWIPHDDFIKLLKAEDKRREPRRNMLRNKGLKTLNDIHGKA